MRVLCLAVIAFLSLVTAAQAQGQWISDAKSGCKVWDEAPEPDEAVSWSGECREGLAHGKGTAIWTIGGKPSARYDGDYSEGHMNGKGKFVLPDGTSYDGDIVNDTWSGQGVQVTAQGDRYEGGWQDNAKHGRGVYVWANGDRFEGEYAEGYPHGKGTYTRKSGEVFAGNWDFGCFHDGKRGAAIGKEAADCKAK